MRSGIIDIFIEAKAEVTDAETERFESNIAARSASVACGFWERTISRSGKNYPELREPVPTRM